MTLLGGLTEVTGGSLRTTDEVLDKHAARSLSPQDAPRPGPAKKAGDR